MKIKLRSIVLSFIFSAVALLGSFALADDSVQWVKKYQSVSGSWSIDSRDDGDYLVLSEDFKTRKGPDLKLMLTNLSVSDVTGKNAANGSVTISPLKSSKGAQSYKLPEAYHDYSTLLIHCEKYSKLWSASNFKQEAE